MITDPKKPLMTSDNTDSNQHSPTKNIYPFFGGAVFGIIILIIPATYGQFNDFGLVQLGFGFVLIISCGLLSILWGEKFIDTVTRILNSTGL